MAAKSWSLTADGNYGTAGNWSPSGVPGAADNVTIPAGSPSITGGLNQSAVAIGDFLVQPGYTGTIGTSAGYLQIDPDRFVFEGTGTAYVDVGSAAIALLVKNTASPATGLRGLYLKGSAISTLSVMKGSVGLAFLSGETSTVTTANVGNLGNVNSDASLWLGSGVTLTTWLQSGGTNIVYCAGTTFTVNDGTLTTEGIGAITTINGNGGTIYPNSTGTITTLQRGTGATKDCLVNFMRSNLARTLTTLTINPGLNVVYDPAVLTITTRAAPSLPIKITATSP